MIRKVIILGGSGMLGFMLVDFLSRDPQFQITATVRTEALLLKVKETIGNVKWQLFNADDQNPLSALDVIDGHEWVINAIGIIKPFIHDDNASEIEQAIRVNSLLPHFITKRAEKAGARVIQIATDCVYSGNKGNYTEKDLHDALDVYGKTKSLGEVYADNFHHLRCSIIGPERKAHRSLLDWFLNQQRGTHVNGYVNHRWNGVTTLHFAMLCKGIMNHDLPLPHVQHIVPAGEVTKYELLQSIAQHYKRGDVLVTPTEAVTAIDRTLTTINESLNKTLWTAAGYIQPPSVLAMLAELKAFNYRHQIGRKDA